MTDIVFNIQDVYMGKAEIGKDVIVRVDGGKVGNDEYVNLDMPDFEVGDEAILFLFYQTSGMENKVVSTDYYVFHPCQGVYLKEYESGSDTVYKAANGDETYKISTAKKEISTIVDELKVNPIEKPERIIE